MKRVLRVGLGVSILAALSCVDRGLTGPAPSSRHAGTLTPASVAGSPNPCSAAIPSPSPLPFAIFSEDRTISSCQGTLTAIFKVQPDPPTGLAPLNVDFNMCKSFDTDPTVTLKYTVDFGDGNSAKGNCVLTEAYQVPGTYAATACVSDRILGHTPICQPYTISVGQSCAVSFSNPVAHDVCPIFITVTARTTGTGSCGNPLTAHVTGSDFSGAPYDVPGQASCPPGTPCTVTFNNVPAPDVPTTATISGVNAQGSIQFSFDVCGCC
jgi:hypothetical protein